MQVWKVNDYFQEDSINLAHILIYSTILYMKEFFSSKEKKFWLIWESCKWIKSRISQR